MMPREPAGIDPRLPDHENVLVTLVFYTASDPGQRPLQPRFRKGEGKAETERRVAPFLVRNPIMSPNIGLREWEG